MKCNKSIFAALVFIGLCGYETTTTTLSAQEPNPTAQTPSNADISPVEKQDNGIYLFRV